MIRVMISYSNTAVRFTEKTIKKAIFETCKALKVKKAAFAVHITSDANVKRLNATYRKKDKPTDVLSFPVHHSHKGEGEENYMGEIILGFPYVSKQAKEKGITVGKEVQMLLIHGVLHVHGFDHENNRDEKEMFAIQNYVAKKIGAPFVDPKTL